MSTTISTNMNLPVPGVGTESGPQWATDLNNCMTIIDAHDHTAGNGGPITPDGMNINKDLTFNSVYSATNVKKTNFTSQVSALTGTNFISFIGGNLYVNDGSGNQIPITAGGGVAGSPGSIGSLTSPAAATYSAGSKTFIWTADSAKAAAMDNGAVTIRETNVASAKGITLASPTALAADYQLTLPSGLPGSTQYLTSTTLGALSYSTADAIGTAMTSTGANAIAASRTRTTGTTVGIGGVAISSSCGTFLTTAGSGSFMDVTNLSVTITTSGRPVRVEVVSDGTSSDATFLVSETVNTFFSEAYFQMIRGVSAIALVRLSYQLTNATNQGLRIPPNLSMVDPVAAGTYTYKVQAGGNGASGNQAGVFNCKLVAYEL